MYIVIGNLASITSICEMSNIFTYFIMIVFIYLFDHYDCILLTVELADAQEM